MKAFLRLFTRLWFLSLLGMLLLSLLLWFEGPLFAFAEHVPLESVGARLWTLLVLWLIWACWLGWRWWRARRADAAMQQAMLGPTTTPAAAATASAAVGATAPALDPREARAITERFQRAMDMLRQRRGSRFGRQYLYELPWYMCVGAPGAGKTTALLNSGLRFPLSESLGAGAVRGVGGTRNCDWWFTDEAVLIDTAGRLTTQDSDHEADRAEWLGFIAELRKWRGRQPINGILLAVSVADLLRGDEQSRQQLAVQVRTRIQELYQQLDMRFPIYVLVTKLDLLAGFTQFFEPLGERERAQVWGFTLPVDEQVRAGAQAGTEVDPLAGLPAEFTALEQRLHSLVLGRLQAERDLQRRAQVFGFPQQLSALRVPLEAFLGQVFQVTRYEQLPWIRGVYFTSGTQQGNPIDRVMAAVAQGFGIARPAQAPQVGTGRSYFLTRLLKDVIFQEAGLAGLDAGAERRRRWFQRIAYVLSALLLVLGVTLLVISHGRNLDLVATAAKKVVISEREASTLLPQQMGVFDPLPLLDSVRALPGGYAERDQSRPWLMGFGLYQGDKLGAASNETYARLLNTVLLPRIKLRLERQLRTSENPDLLYEGLRVYLMLGDRKHFDAEAINAWFSVDVERTMASEGSDEQRHTLLTHLAALFDPDVLDFSQPVNQEVIDLARHNLERVPLAQRVYSRLSRSFGGAGLADFTVFSAAGPEAGSALARRSGESLGRGVPGLYTVAGYRRFLARSASASEDVAKESWVLGQSEQLSDAGAVDRLGAALRQFYFDDYIRRWQDFLEDLTVVSFSNPDVGARVLGLLSGPASPLRKLLVAAARETALSGVAAPKSLGDTLSDTLKDKLKSSADRVRSALGAGDVAAPAAANPSATPVDIRFEPLHRLVDNGGQPGNAPLDRTLGLLADLKAFLDASAAARAQGLPMPRPESVDKVSAEAKSAPPGLARALEAAAAGASSATVGGERERLNSLWQSSVASYCQQATAGRYPFNPRGTEEVPQEDFSHLLAPGGMIDDFFQKNLQASVDTGGPNWRWRAVGQHPLGIPDEVLRNFQAAAAIRDAFFRGGHTPSIRFELKPVSIDKALSQVNIDIDGQVVSLSQNSAARSVPLNWPGNSGTSSTIRVDWQVAGSPGNGFTVQGPWALLRLLDRGTLTRSPQRERFEFALELDGHKVVVELAASSVLNPFQLEALTRFRCPARL